jgi:uncharacterized protein (DUF2252 family)
MRKYVKVEGQPDFAKDMHTGAIVNVNQRQVEAARRAKEIRKQKKLDEEKLKQQVDNLEKGFDEIKSMLQSLIDINKTK